MHDSRHTLITELSESGAGDQTIMDIAGHVSRQMLKHYSHIRMQAKRDALQVIGENQKRAEDTVNNAKPAQDCSPEPTDAQEVERESLQKSLQSRETRGGNHRKAARKSLKELAPQDGGFRMDSPCACLGAGRQPRHRTPRSRTDGHRADILSRLSRSSVQVRDQLKVQTLAATAPQPSLSALTPTSRSGSGTRMPRAWLWPSICAARWEIWIVAGWMGKRASNS